MPLCSLLMQLYYTRHKAYIVTFRTAVDRRTRPGVRSGSGLSAWQHASCAQIEMTSITTRCPRPTAPARESERQRQWQVEWPQCHSMEIRELETSETDTRSRDASVRPAQTVDPSISKYKPATNVCLCHTLFHHHRRLGRGRWRGCGLGRGRRCWCSGRRIARRDCRRGCGRRSRCMCRSRS